MRRQQNPNLEILEKAVAALGSLADQLVFLGGCATGLLITDPAAPPIRVTRDVDVISEVTSLQAHYALAKRLHQLGFVEDTDPDAPICRWRGHGILLDVMPTDSRVLGFGNPYYQPAMVAAQPVTLLSGMCIRTVTAPWFLLTKLAAFDGRGKGDYLASQDIEDIVAVIDGRQEIVTEVRASDGALRQDLAHRFGRLLGDNKFMQALPGHMPSDTSSPARLPLVEERIRNIAGAG